MPVSKATRQSVDTTIPQAVYKWVLAREEAVNIMTVELGRRGELPALIKEMKKAELSIKSVKDRVKNKDILSTDADYVEARYNDFVMGLDNRLEKGGAKGNKKNLPFIKKDGSPFKDQDITDAMKGGNFPTGFLANRVANTNSAEFKNTLAVIAPNDGRTEDTRKTQIMSELRNPTVEKKEEPKPTLTKEEQASANMAKEAEEKKERDKKEAEEKKERDEAEAQLQKDKAEKDAQEAEETEGVEVSDVVEEEAEKEGEFIQLEDVAEEDGLKSTPSLRTPRKPEVVPVGPSQAPTEDVGTPPPPDDEPIIDPLPQDLPDNRGTIEELPDILDASRGGVGMTPSSIMKGGDSSGKEDAQRSKMNIARLKEEIRALHLIYDNNIEKFRSNPHQGDKEDALKSDKIEVVRQHHKDMEKSVRDYYRSGGGDTLQVGVIVPIDTYLQQYLSGGTANEVSIPKAPTRTTGKEGTTSVGLGHRDGDLTSKKHDPYSRAIAQGIYYQRGGMGTYKQRGVSGHTVKIGGKDKIGAIKDPTVRVDAVMNNFLNRAVKELPNPSLKLKT